MLYKNKNHILFIFIILFSLSACNKDDNPAQDNSRSVKYEVTGSASSVSLTLNNATRGTEQIDSAPLPWARSFTVQKGAFLYVSAQNNGSSGSITASVYVNNNLLQTVTSSGAYVIATASGDAP